MTDVEKLSDGPEKQHNLSVVEHNIQVDKIKSDIYGDRVSFLKKLNALYEKAQNKKKQKQKKAAEAAEAEAEKPKSKPSRTFQKADAIYKSADFNKADQQETSKVEKRSADNLGHANECKKGDKTCADKFGSETKTLAKTKKTEKVQKHA